MGLEFGEGDYNAGEYHGEGEHDAQYDAEFDDAQHGAEYGEIIDGETIGINGGPIGSASLDDILETFAENNSS